RRVSIGRQRTEGGRRTTDDGWQEREAAVNPSSVVRLPASQLKLSFLNAWLIHEPEFSRGSRPLDFTSWNASLYQALSGKLCPSTAAAVCASSMMPSAM